MSSPAAQLVEVLERSRGLGVYAYFQLDTLRFNLKNVGKELPDFVLDFIPIRIVTILENAFRATIKGLVDQNADCRRNGVAYITKIPNRHIAEVVLSLHEKAFTLGDVVSNTLSCSRIEDIISGMESVYGDGFKVDLADSRERWIEDKGNYAESFIQDLDMTLRHISKLFTIRHILVHEIPRLPPYARDDLEVFLDHAEHFTKALSWLVPKRLFGAVPRTQSMMNVLSAGRAQKAGSELADHIDFPIVVSECLEDYDQNMVWHWFAHLVADARSGATLGQVHSGSIAPTLYFNELERLHKWRLEDIKDHPDRFKAIDRHRMRAEGILPRRHRSLPTSADE